MILNATGSFDSTGSKVIVSINVQPHTELEHEILLLFFQNRSVSLSEEHNGDELAVKFSITDATVEGLATRNLERIKSEKPRFMSVDEEEKAAAAAKAAFEEAKKEEANAQAAAAARAEATAKAQADAIVERAAQLIAAKTAGEKEQKAK